MPSDTDTATQLGREAGSTPGRCASDYPHPHSMHDLRIAWMDGFSQGRVELQGTTGSGPATPE